MARPGKWIETTRLRRQRGYWKRAVKGVADCGNVELAHQLDAAKRLGKILRRFQSSAALKLGRTNFDPRGGLPKNTIWAHRPDPWSAPLSPRGIAPVQSGQKLGNDVTVYHDCNDPQISLRQTAADDDQHYALQLDTLSFSGNYLSFAVALDRDVIKTVTRNELIRMDVALNADYPFKAMGRVNVQVGPNVEQINRDLELNSRSCSLEFDLFYVELEGQEISDIWVDLIFERPDMNRIVVSDLRISRRPRANI